MQGDLKISPEHVPSLAKGGSARDGGVVGDNWIGSQLQKLTSFQSLEGFNNPTGGEEKSSRSTFIRQFSTRINVTLNQRTENNSTLTLEDMRSDMKKFLTHSLFGKTYDLALLILSMLSPVIYIYSTYVTSPYPNSAGDDVDIFTPEEQEVQLALLNQIEVALASLFTFDWFLNFFLAEYKGVFITNFFAMVDVMTIIPIYVKISVGEKYQPPISRADAAAYVPYGTLYFIYFLGTTRILRGLRLRRRIIQIDDAIQKQLAEIALTASITLLFFAAVIQYLEFDDQFRLFHTWVYYVWITVATVGYGDIFPITGLGRFVAMTYVAMGLVAVSKFSNELIEKMALQSIYARLAYVNMNKFGKHIVIIGTFQSVSVSDFFKELFHDDHDNNNLHAVVLFPERPTFELLMLLREAAFSLNITYLEGSSLLTVDLNRAKVNEAVGVFIMTDKFSVDPDVEDQKTILQQFSIKRYMQMHQQAHQKMRVFMQVIRPENRRHLMTIHDGEEANDVVLCLNELKMGIIAQSIMFPGAAALLMNIIASFADDEDEDVDAGGSAIEVIDDNETGTWLGEYERGCDWEIYVTELDSSLVGLTFSQVSLLIYQKKGIVVFGARMFCKGVWSTMLNPANLIIPENSESNRMEVFVLAKNSADANLSGDRSGLFSSSLIFKSDLSKITRQDSESKESKEVEASKEDVPDVSKKVGWQKLLNKFKRHNNNDENVNESLHQQRDVMERETCYINDVIPDLNSVTILTSISEEFPTIKNHTLVIGKSMGNIYDLISAIRQKIGNHLRPIVIMYPEPFPYAMWQRISKFSQIYIIRGMALEEGDLRRAGIFKAANVILLSDSSKAVEEGTKSNATKKKAGSESLVDSDVIFCYRLVHRMNAKIQAVVEIVSESNIKYMVSGSTYSGEVNYRLTPPFAAGVLFTSSLLDTLMCQVFYSPSLIGIIDAIVSPQASHSHAKKRKVERGRLLQIPVPDGLESRTYGALYSYLASRKIIPVALYRGIFPHMTVGPKGNVMPYVFTNPQKDTEIFSCDRVFVFASDSDAKRLHKDRDAHVADVGKKQDLTMDQRAVQRLDTSEASVKGVSESLDALALDVTALQRSMNRKFDSFIASMEDLNNGTKFRCMHPHNREKTYKNIKYDEVRPPKPI